MHDIRRERARISGGAQLDRRIETLDELLAGFANVRERERFTNLPESQVAAYRDVFGAVAAFAKTGREALRMIESIVQRTRATSTSDAIDATMAGAPVDAHPGSTPTASRKPPNGHHIPAKPRSVQ